MMRLLKRSPSGRFVLVSVDEDVPPPYAILSHTWDGGQEVTYNELVTGTGKTKTGYNKIQFCVDKAAEDGIEYCWVDTCCIDKSDAAELSTAINSMFRWYQRAEKCYVYLSDVEVPDEVRDVETFRISWMAAFRRSRWFTRGWTLQELLAPAAVKFFSKEGRRLGSRISLEQDIYEITKIPVEAMRGRRLTEFSVEERMRWAATRRTTWREDKIYCLLGIFGVFLPLIYGEGEAHAELRLREEIQKRRDGRGTARPQDVTVSSSLSFQRNELFTGREDELRSLEQFLVPTMHQRMTVCGLGGGGKSALAIEFAYRALAQNARRLVFWVPAISRESFELAYREIGVRLGIRRITDDNADVKQLVKDALGDSEREWLMIVDNVDDLDVLMSGAVSGAGGDHDTNKLLEYLPHSDNGKIVFTTRSRKVAEELTQNRVLQLPDMGPVEARQLLARRIAKQALLADETAVDKLLELLAYLPLAIVQAAAFMNNNDMSVGRYVSLFRDTGAEAELFSEHFSDPNRYREVDSTIAKTWYISFDQIRRKDELAADYLSFMACIDRINIPRSLLPPGGSAVQQAKALGTLKAYAFITEQQMASQELGGEEFFDMHRLVHMASVWWLDSHAKQTAWVAKAVARLEQLVPYGGYEDMEIWTRYLPHAMHVAGSHGGLDETARLSLLCRVERCQSSLGRYSTAETILRQVCTLREKKLGAEHPDTLESMGNLSAVLHDQGKYEEAEAMTRQTLAQREKVLGADHRYTLASMNILAVVLRRQGKYQESEVITRQTLAQKERVLGADHLDTLVSKNNLALVLRRLGKHEEADAIMRQTLAQRQKVLGANHPDTLVSKGNLALALEGQRKYEEAEAMNRQTLAQREKVLGAGHPHTLASMYNLARVLALQQRYEEADSLYRRACAGHSTVFGHDHPYTRACRDQYSQMIALQEQHQGAISPETLSGDKGIRAHMA